MDLVDKWTKEYPVVKVEYYDEQNALFVCTISIPVKDNIVTKFKFNVTREFFEEALQVLG